MATVYEIVQGLSQAAANAYDGALGEDYEPLKTGALRREEGDMLIDRRVMDGFGVKFYGNMMCLTYQSEIQLKEIYGPGFESEIDQRMIDIFAENSSRVRSWVTAKKHFKVGGLDEAMNDDNSGNANPVEKSWETFLGQGGWNGTGGKRPDNDSRKKDKGPQS
jgi:hypothetical protein